MELGKRVKLRREELGLSQDELAKRLGYKSRSSINKIELGVNDVSQSKIKYLAEALHTTPAYLMGWSDEPQKENKPEKPELAENMIVYHRDGKTSEIKLSPKKMDLLIQMIEEFKENDNPDL